MYIRYELYLDEEYQGVGILQGMDDAGFSDDLSSDLTFRINRELSIPSFVFREHRHTESWFTEEGAKRFEKDIQAILKEYEYDGLFEVRKRIVDKLEDVVYEDENQVVVDTKKQYQKKQEDEQKTMLIRNENFLSNIKNDGQELEL